MRSGRDEERTDCRRGAGAALMHVPGLLITGAQCSTDYPAVQFMGRSESKIALEKCTKWVYHLNRSCVISLMLVSLPLPTYPSQEGSNG